MSEAGAELVRLVDHAGADWLWDGDPAYWSGRAPLLFPIVGTLAGGRFRTGEQSYKLPRHGFARNSFFRCVDHSHDSVTLRLEPTPAIRESWPFDFRLDVRYAVEGSTLTISAEVLNQGAEPMPASFGFHPALRWPLPGEDDRSSHEILFDEEEPAAVRRLDCDGLVDPVARPSPIAGKRLALDDSLFGEDALILDCPRSRALTFTGQRNSVRFAFPGMPHLAFWTKPGAGFLCIEPWQGYSDPAGFDGKIADKPGILSIAPGEARDFAMSLTLYSMS
ncbi:MAG: aldose 1-epimerase family protein [Alphaproteobacteria bacterium]